MRRPLPRPSFTCASTRPFQGHMPTRPIPACSQVLGVYGGRRWGLIEEHLHDALGRQAREGGDAGGAAQHFMAMLDCPGNNLYCQKLYLTQFMDALQQAQAQLVRSRGIAAAHN